MLTAPKVYSTELRDVTVFTSVAELTKFRVVFQKEIQMWLKVLE